MRLNPAVLDSLSVRTVEQCAVPGLAVAVCDSSGPIYAAGLGLADIGSSARCTPETGFALSSVTKTFTAWLLLKLESIGLLRLDDPIRSLLPEFAPRFPGAAEPSLRDALSHSSGVSGYEELWYAASWSRAEIMRRLGRALPGDPPGSRFRYSNLMVTIAGEAAARATGLPFEDALRKYVLVPSNTSEAAFEWRHVAHPASGYARQTDGTLRRLADVDTHRASAALGLKASVSCLSRWLSRLLAAQDGGAVRTMWTPQIDIRPEDDPRIYGYYGRTKCLKYGLGWFLAEHEGMCTVAHTGALPGFRSHLALLPDAGIGVIALANLEGTLAPEIFVYSVMDLVAGRDPSGWFTHFEQVRKNRELLRRHSPDDGTRRTLPRVASDRRAGVYENPVLGFVDVSQAGRVLRLKWASYDCELAPSGDGQFQLSGLNCPLMGPCQMAEFLPRDDGAGDELRFLGETFVKIRPPESHNVGRASARAGLQPRLGGVPHACPVFR